MPTAVQARSLASLTWLAANPPQYLGSSNQPVQQPLVLYIARVPGSKDIFLTPLKPRQKVVTAEDVQSSVYYVHVDRDEDELLAQHSTGAEAEENQDSTTSLEQIREDLDEVYPEKSSTDPQTAPKMPPGLHPEARLQPHPQRAPTVKRKPVGSSAKSPLLEKSDPLVDIGETPVRRPLGPRPLSFQPENRAPVSTSGSPPRTNRRAVRPYSADYPNSISRPYWDSPENAASRPKKPGSFQNDPFAAGTSKLPAQGPYTSENHPYYGPRHSLASQYRDAISLTLIRRDPGSSTQWNVGRVTIPSTPGTKVQQGVGVSSDSEKGNDNTNSISIEITNTGYNKFSQQDQQSTSPRPSFERGLSGGSNPATSEEAKKLFNQQDLANGVHVFRRTLQFDEAEPWRHKMAEVVRTNSQRHSLRRSSYSGDPQRLRDPEDDAVEKLRFPNEYTRNTRREHSGSSSVQKGYSFVSPWGGWCRFTSGLSGGNLKCRHNLVASNTGVPISSSIVSELRFNLPSPAAKAQTKSPTKSLISSNASASASASSSSDTSRGKRSSFLSGHMHRKSNSHDANISRRLRPLERRPDTTPVPADMDEAERLDLSLGQELAGGGFGGKQAKLGKLIIESEGSKMLDLLVAANIGLWWKVYDRTVLF